MLRAYRDFVATLVNKPFASARRSRQPIQSAKWANVNCAIEVYEPRIMLSATLISGTPGNDVISLQAGATSFTATVNGVATQYSTLDVTTITIDSESGTDVVNILGTNSGIITTVTSSGSATINVGNMGSTNGILGPLEVTNLTSHSSIVNVDDSADTTGRTVTFDTQVFGNSVSGMISGLAPALILFNYPATSSANVKLGTGTNAENFYAPVSGGTTLNVLGGGATDVASFQAAGNNVFVGGANQGRLTNTTGYSAGISGVGTVAAYAANGNDQANLDLRGAPNSTLVGAPGQTSAQGQGFATYAFGFGPVYAYGKGGDVAQLHPADNDTLIGTPAYEYIAGQGYLVQTIGFGNNYGYGDPSNVAKFYPGDHDTMVGASNYAYITGPGYVDAAVGFGNVYSYGNSTNSAQFFPAMKGQFVASPILAYVWGSGYVDAAVGFGSVTASGDSSNSASFIPGSQDNFVVTPTEAYINGSGYAAIAHGFGTILAYGGSTNTASFYLDSNYQFTSYEGLDASMTNIGKSLNVIALGFNTVNAYAKDNTDVAFLYDSQGNDTFYGRGSYAGMFSGSLIVSTSNFGSVNAYSMNGGLDVLDVANLNYLFKHFGNWM